MAVDELAIAATAGAPGWPGTLTEPGAPTRGAASDELAPGTSVGEYIIDREIGSGGMGVVYAAAHPVIGKRVAVKTIKRDRCANQRAVARFVNEARAVNQIGHPNIVDVFAFGTLDDGRSYLIMELLDGESVRARLDRTPPLTLDEISHIVPRMCRALEAAHAAGIVHRDLKPENVFLADVPGEPPQVKLLDFGIAKLDEPNEIIDSTETGQILGTPAYMSPEQARGRDITECTDVYSLGVMVYEMCTGRRPLDALSSAEMISLLLTEPPPDPRHIRADLPESLSDLIVRMLAKDRSDRPALPEVRETFERLQLGAPAAAPTPRRRIWLAVATSVAVLAAVFAIVSMRAPGVAPARSPGATPVTPPADAAGRHAPAATAGPHAGAVASAPDAGIVASAPDAAVSTTTPQPKPAVTKRRHRGRRHRAHRRPRHRRRPDAGSATTPPKPPPDDDAPLDPFAKPK